MNQFYGKLIKYLKYIGKVTQKIVSIEIFGYYAIVKTLESSGQGNYLKIAKKRVQKSGDLYVSVSASILQALLP